MCTPTHTHTHTDLLIDIHILVDGEIGTCIVLICALVMMKVGHSRVSILTIDPLLIGWWHGDYSPGSLTRASHWALMGEAFKSKVPEVDKA